MSLFGTLCEDELYNIVRHASKAPNTRAWKSRLTASDLSLLSSARGPFRSVTNDVFKHLALTQAHFARTRTPPTFPAVDMLKAFGRCATTLDIEALPPDSEAIRAVVAEVAANCQHVTALSVNCGVDDLKLWEPLMQGLMEAVGTQLTELTFHPQLNMPERELEGTIYWITARCMNLKRFSFSAQNSAALDLIQSVWYSARNTLEDITIASRLISPLDWAKTLAEIREHCRRLTHFRLDCNMYSKPPDDHLAEMLASYWTQLQFAGLGEMSQQRCEFVARVCPNAKFSLYVMDNNINGMLALGRKLCHVKIDMMEPPDQRVMAEAMNACPELVELDITSPCCRELAFEAPFLRKKHYLRKLTLVVRGFVMVEDTLTKAARATSELTYLNVDVGNIRDPNAFAAVAKANRQLKEVEIRTVRPLAVNLVVAILKSFLVCEALQSIKVSFRTWLQLDPRESAELAEKCAFLRFRRIYVEVGRNIIRG